MFSRAHPAPISLYGECLVPGAEIFLKYPYVQGGPIRQYQPVKSLLAKI